MKRNAIIIAIVAVLIIGGIIFLVTSGNNNDTANTSTTPSTSTQTTQPANDSSSSANTAEPGNDNGTNTAAVTTITYSNGSFSPATITVKSGDTVEVKNTSSESIQFQSDPHPAHTDNPELNVGTIAAGKSATFTVKTTGTWGYHNHLDQTETGTIVVQ